MTEKNEDPLMHKKRPRTEPIEFVSEPMLKKKSTDNIKFPSRSKTERKEPSLKIWLMERHVKELEKKVDFLETKISYDEIQRWEEIREKDPAPWMFYIS